MKIELGGINDVSIAESELDSIAQSKFQKADWSKAMEYSKKEGVLDRNEQNEEPKHLPLWCDVKEFKKYGIGLFFYFDMLKKLSIFFVIATFLCGPAFYSNFTGDGLNSTSGIGVIQKLSISNQPQLQVMIPNSTATPSEKEEARKENQQRVDIFVTDQVSFLYIHNHRLKRKQFVWIPDLAYSIGFFVFIMYYKGFSSRAESKDKTIQPSHYSVEVKGLPKNALDTNEVRSFFNLVVQRHTKITDKSVVMEVAFQKDFKDTLFLHCQEAEMIEEIMIEKKKIEIKKEAKGNVRSMKEDLLEKERELLIYQTQLQQQISEKLGGVHDYKSYDTLSAFVIFNTFEQKKEIVSLFKKYSHQHWLVRYVFCCFIRKTPVTMLFRGKYKISLKDRIDQPSNIKWENIDVTTFSRILRKICVFLVMVMVMIITLGAIIAANVFQPGSTANCASNQYSLSEVVAMNSESEKQCYCASQSMSSILSDSDVKNYCWDIYLAQLKTEILIGLTTLAIVLANSLLAAVLRQLTKFLRFPTISQETTTTAVLLFIATFTNTAILTLLLQANISGFIPSLYFTSPIPPLKEALESKVTAFSPDFNREWYAQVGSKIMLTMIISTFWPHILDLLITPIKKRWRFWRAKSKLIQHEMNKLVVGTEFNMAWHYTSLLNIVFVALFYSSGQPLLIPCAAFALSTQYWVFKYRILRWHKKPPAFDEKLNNTVLRIIPWALMFHIAIGAYMYGQPLIFPRNSEQVIVKISDSLNQAGVYEVSVTTDQESPAIDRAYSSSILFLLLVAIVGMYFAEFTVLKFLSCILSKLLPCCFGEQNSNKVANFDLDSLEKQSYAVQYKKMGQLASYDMRLNENYFSLIQAIDIGSSTHNTPRSNRSPRPMPLSPCVQPRKSKFLADGEQTGGNVDSSENLRKYKLRV